MSLSIRNIGQAFTDAEPMLKHSLEGPSAFMIIRCPDRYLRLRLRHDIKGLKLSLQFSKKHAVRVVRPLPG